MPYRGNPLEDPTDAIRLLIGDTSTSTGGEIFADGEIDYFAAQKPNPYLAASAAVKSIVGTSRGNTLANVLSKQVGDLRLQYSQESSSTILTGKASELRREGVRKVTPYAGGISQSDKRASETDTDRVDPAFKVGQHDHPGTSTGHNDRYSRYS